MAYTWWSAITLREYLEGSNPSYAFACQYVMRLYVIFYFIEFHLIFVYGVQMEPTHGIYKASDIHRENIGKVRILSYALAYHIMDAHYRFKFIRSSYGTPLRLVFNLGAKYHFLSGVLRRELQNSFYYIENSHSLNDILSI